MAEEQSTGTDEQAPQHHSDRRTTVMVALIAAAAVLIGSFLTYFGTLLSAKVSADSYDNRTQRDFIHTQRIAALSSLLGDAQTLLTAVQAEETNLAFQTTTKLSLSDVASLDERLHADADRLAVDEARVMLVDDPSIFQKVDDLVQDGSTMALDGVALIACHAFDLQHTEIAAEKTFCTKNSKEVDDTNAKMAGEISGLAILGRLEIGSS